MWPFKRKPQPLQPGAKVQVEVVNPWPNLGDQVRLGQGERVWTVSAVGQSTTVISLVDTYGRRQSREVATDRLRRP